MTHKTLQLEGEAPDQSVTMCDRCGRDFGNSETFVLEEGKDFCSVCWATRCPPEKGTLWRDTEKHLVQVLTWDSESVELLLVGTEEQTRVTREQFNDFYSPARATALERLILP